MADTFHCSTQLRTYDAIRMFQEGDYFSTNLTFSMQILTQTTTSLRINVNDFKC